MGPDRALGVSPEACELQGESVKLFSCSGVLEDGLAGRCCGVTARSLCKWFDCILAVAGDFEEPRGVAM